MLRRREAKDLFQPRDVREIERERTWVLYGRSGTGKTTLAATFPKPLLLFDIKDRGTDSINDVEGIDVVDIKSWDQVEDIYIYLTSAKHHYKTIVFDTITQMYQLAQWHILDKLKKKTRAGDWGSMSQRQWGEVTGLLKDKLMDFRDAGIELDCEIVFIAQDKRRQQEIDNEIEEAIHDPEIGPSVPPSVAGLLNASVSIIGQTYVRMHTKRERIRGKTRYTERPVFCIRMGPDAQHITKVRNPKSIEVPSFVENPTYRDLLNIIRGTD